jgi:hypothetical protein
MDTIIKKIPFFDRETMDGYSHDQHKPFGNPDEGLIFNDKESVVGVVVLLRMVRSYWLHEDNLILYDKFRQPLEHITTAFIYEQSSIFITDNFYDFIDKHIIAYYERISQTIMNSEGDGHTDAGFDTVTIRPTKKGGFKPTNTKNTKDEEEMLHGSDRFKHNMALAEALGDGIIQRKKQVEAHKNFARLPDKPKSEEDRWMENLTFPSEKIEAQVIDIICSIRDSEKVETLKTLREPLSGALYALIRNYGTSSGDPYAIDNDPSFEKKFLDTGFLIRLQKTLEFKRNPANKNFKPTFEVTSSRRCQQ